MLQSMGSQRVRHNWAAELNWDLKYYSEVSFFLPTQYQPQPYVYINEDFKKKKKSTKAPGVGYGQGSRACCSPWGCKESDTTEQLNWTELAWNVPFICLIFLKRSLVFPIQLFSSISSHCSLRKAFLSLLGILWNSAYKLNKQNDNIQPWCTPFPIWNQSVVPCLVLTVAKYKFLRRQVR